MATLTTERRSEMPKKEFGQPEKRGFPMNDKTHDRLAISGASRSENAGNISHSEAERIKAEARGKLHGEGGDPKPDHKMAVGKMHPEHVHALVQAAHGGKFGPDAQQMAQKAMQPMPQSQPQDQNAPQRDYSSIFSGQGGGDSDGDEGAPQPAGRAQMFG